MRIHSEGDSDAQLVQSACAGDSAAFEALITRYFGMVHAIAFARLGQREAAEDLAQEVFLRAHLNLSDLREPRYFSAWLTQIARNLAVNWVRDEQRRSRCLGLVPIGEIEAEIADPQSLQEHETMLKREEGALVREAIFRLEPETREIVLLRYSEEMGVADIARRLGVHRITVRRQLSKALAALRRELEPVLGETARAWRSPKRAVARTTAIVAGVAALSSTAKSSLAAAITSNSSTVAIAAATRGVSALPGNGTIGFIQSMWGAAKAWLAGGGAVMATGKAVAVIVVGAGLAVGGAHYHGLRTAEAGETSSTQTQPAAQVSLSPVLSLPPSSERDLLEKAEGAAALLDVEQTDVLTEQALAKANDPRVRAAAFWARALAYTRYGLEYKTDKFEAKRQEAVKQMAQLQPEFLTSELPTWEVGYAFAVPPPDAARVEKLVSQARASLAGKAATDPAAAFRLGRTLDDAAGFYRDKKDPAKSRAYYDEACRAMAAAAKARPGNYEYQAYYLTVLATRAVNFEKGRNAEVTPLGERIAKQFAGKFAYPPVGDRGPLYLHVAAASISDPKESKRLFAKYVADNPTDAWLQYAWVLEGELALQNKGNPPAKELDSLLRRMEEGQIDVRGTGIIAMASAYYRLIVAQTDAGQLQEALRTCDKLAAIAPHFGTLSYNRALILYRLAEKEADQARKADLLSRALTSVEAQIPYNYHGTAQAEAEKLRATIQKAMAPR